MTDRPIEMIVVPHTHWDREWYWPFERFRLELARVVDHVLAVLEQDPAFRYFLLDGHAAVLEDYLEARPENRERLRMQIAAGRLGVGPWYTLPDGFLPSGESLIRNLLLGHRVAGVFGPVTKEGYCPDTFSHPAQLPQILAGFSIDSFFFMRGLGEDVQTLRSEFAWEAPDGSRVLAHFLSESYTNAAILRRTPEETVLHHGRLVNYDSLTELRDRLAARAATDTVLLMNGGDHLDVQEDLPGSLQALRGRMPDRLVHGTLREFVERVRAKGAPRTSYRGELLLGRYFHTNLGCLSTRMYLKQRNAETQMLLERLAEPLAAVARLLGAPSWQSLLWHAWRHVLHNHAHDSICGCSLDPVHDEMLARYDRAAEIARAVARTSLDHVADRVAAPNQDEGIPVVIFNPLPWTRTDCVEAEIVPYTGFPYGVRTFTPSGYRELDLRRCALVDDEGRTVPYELLEERIIVQDPLNRRKVLPAHGIRFVARDVPGLGYRTVSLVPRPRGATRARATRRRGERSIENEFFRVSAGQDGSLNVEDLRAGRLHRGLHYFEDVGDAGDEYAFAAPEQQELIESRGGRATIEVVRGPVDQTLRVGQQLRLPSGLAPDGRRRSTGRVACPISSAIRLFPGVRRIEIETTVANAARDHRLRVAFPTGAPATAAVADDTFQIARRSLTGPDGADWEEPPVPARPHQTFVAVEHTGHGLAVASVGLPEHEVTTDGVIHLTLLRCVGYLGRPSGVPRKGLVGPPIETPGAQCLGVHRFRYAIIPFEGGCEDARIWQPAADLNAPMVAVQKKRSRGDLPARLTLLGVDPPVIHLSAVKLADDENSVIVRVYNLAGHRVRGTVELFRAIRVVGEVNLNEEGTDDRVAPPDGHRFTVELGPHQIKTLKIFGDSPGNSASAQPRAASPAPP